MRMPGSGSIFQKIAAFVAIPMTIIVVVLSTYFPARHIATLKKNLVEEAEAYDAVIFQLERTLPTRQAAAELLQALTVDPELKAAVLYDARGNVIHAVGSPDPATRALATRATTRQLIQDPEHVTVVHPIVLPGGERGALAIELSTVQLRGLVREVFVTAIAVGGLALLLGVLAAWLMARSLAGRIRRIAEVASGVAGGDLRHELNEDASPDEIGQLTRAFGTMLGQLRGLISNIQTLAEREQRTLGDVNRTLEDKVDERTSALQAANEQLRREMIQRQEMEIGLRHAQKLESVGRLAAGVAHEINTPIQFVGNNITFFETSLRDLVHLCDRYRDILHEAGGPLGRADLDAAREAEATADLEFVRQNLDRAIASTQDGIGRVTRIVQSMKAFAHPDQGERSLADLNAALQSTLTVATHELKYVADVELQLGDLPLVPCLLGDLNQVFLNLLVNAAHAIGDVVKESGEKGLIRVTSAVTQGDQVVIAISDSGTGIPEDARLKIFDPFFTTKEVGRGTGQGLALARAVVDKHGGTLTFDTELGRGTTFYVRLPINPEHSPVGAGAT